MLTLSPHDAWPTGSGGPEQQVPQQHGAALLHYCQRARLMEWEGQVPSTDVPGQGSTPRKLGASEQGA